MMTMGKSNASTRRHKVSNASAVESYFEALTLQSYQGADEEEDLQEKEPRPILAQSQDPSSWYFTRLNQLSRKTLTAKDELTLAEQSKKGSEKAREALVQSNLRLVVYIAKSFFRQGVDFMDLIQAGNYGLMKAVDKFDYARGHRFSTYAAWWIRQSVLQYFTEHDRVIRLPGHVVTQINKVRQAVDRLSRMQDKHPSLEQLAKTLNLPAQKVEELIQLFNKPLSIESVQNTHTNDPEEAHTPLALKDERYHPERLMISEYRKQLLQQAFASELTETEQTILSKRFALEWARIEEGNTSDNLKMTLENLGEALGVSRECVRQTEKKALLKLKNCALLQHLMD
jgi:RNA polymerase primary sigma factor